MKKLKMFCLTFMMLFVCTLGAHAASLSFSENSASQMITVNGAEEGYKYQWVHVDYSDYTSIEAELKAMVTEIKSLASAYNSAVSDYQNAVNEYNSAISSGTLSRAEKGELYNKKIVPALEKVNSSKEAYDKKCDDFYKKIETIAPRDESAWHDLTGTKVEFEPAGYSQADAAVIWVDTNKSEYRYEAKIYMFDERTVEIKAEVDCPIVNNYCQVVDDTYFGIRGTEVTKEVYESECMPKVCKVDGDKFYGIDGKEVTEKVYKEECESEVVNPTCEIKDGKYFDDKGNSVTKDAYEKACPSNPKTGLTLPVALGIIIVSLCGLGIIISNKKKMFNQV